MPQPLLATKTFVPRRRPRLVSRPRLRERLDQPGGHRLVLLCAPAGFGKTTLVTDWIAGLDLPVAWLSLDEADADPSRFLAYLATALEGVVPGSGSSVLAMLGAPQPPPMQDALTGLINDLSAAAAPVVLVLDDLHTVDSPVIDAGLAFLVEHLPPAMRLVIATREDPALPLARLRARGEVLELRAADLRFTTDESETFLDGVMDLRLGRPRVEALETVTEGWIAGLQLAAISLQQHPDPDAFIESFSGSHRFVLDYLLEEVLGRQPPEITRFLLATSILDRLSGPLCDAVTQDPSATGQTVIEELERANLFIVPLDGERGWYRYHHLFRDLLRQRLRQAEPEPAVDALHVRASAWLEANGSDVEAFQHAAAGHDLDRAERLIEGGGLPLYVRGALVPILGWLATLPPDVLDARPKLRATHATVLLASGHVDGVAEMLDRAEADVAAAGGEGAAKTIASIAITRSLLALSQHRADLMISESRRALALLPETALVARSTVHFTLGYASEVMGDRAEARASYEEAVSISRLVGSRFAEMAALTGIGSMQELDMELRAAAATYEEAIQRSAGMQYPVISEAYLGLGRIAYAWNDLPRARALGARSLELGRRLQHTDRPVASQVLLALVAHAEGDSGTAARILADADREVRAGGFVRQAPDVAGARVMVLVAEGRIKDASAVLEDVDVPLASARVRLAEGDPAAALDVLEPFLRRAEERGWTDDQARALVLCALAHDATGATTLAATALGRAIGIAEPEGAVRLFLDERAPMARLLRKLAPGPLGEPAHRLLAAFRASATRTAESKGSGVPIAARDELAEQLTGREVELLGLLADGLTNAQIAERLFLSPQTVKVHVRNIYGKLGVGSRTQAVASARDLGLLVP